MLNTKTFINYLTEYKLENESYSFFVTANSLKEAEEIINIRNIGEKIVGELENSPIPKTLNSLELLHYVSFLSFIALKSGKLTIEEVLGDRGVLHELIHIISGTSDEITTNNIHKQIQDLFSCISISPCIGYTISPIDVTL